jgi:hypothetical protein
MMAAAGQSILVSGLVMADHESQLRLHLIEDSGDSSLALVKKPKRESNEDYFPLPYAPVKRKKVVLDEEEYIYALESIIERDFFPDSAKLKDHVNLLEEYEKGASLESLRRIKEKIIAEERKFGATPCEYQSQSIDNAADPEEAPSGIDADLTVDEFFKYYNSEDNASFEKIHEKDLAERRRKLHWLYETSDAGKNAGMLMWYHSGGKVLSAQEREKIDRMLEYPATLGDDRPNGVDTWRFRVRNQLMFPPELEASRDTCYLPSDTDPAARARRRQLTDGSATSSSSSGEKWRRVPALTTGAAPLLLTSDTPHLAAATATATAQIEDGSMRSEASGAVAVRAGGPGREVAGGMPLSEHELARPGGADGSRSLSMPPPSSAPSALSHRHMSAARRELEKRFAGGEIQHRNTRLRGAFLQDRERALGEGEGFPGGVSPLHTPSGVSPLELPHTPSSYADSSDGESGAGGGEGGYRAVPMTPSPLPDALIGEGRVAHSPLLTWGEIFATPVALDRAYPSASSVSFPLATPSSAPGGGERGGILEGLGKHLDTSAMSDSFHMTDLQPRERLAHKLEERVRLKKKQQLEAKQSQRNARLSGGTPNRTPLSTSSAKTPRTGTGRGVPSTPLTPAGLALAQKLAASSSARSGGGLGLGMGNRGIFAGSNKHSTSKGVATTPISRAAAAPAASSSERRGESRSSRDATSSSKSSSSLTDGLLQI